VHEICLAGAKTCREGMLIVLSDKKCMQHREKKYLTDELQYSVST
jgi:hypothetical protein